MYKAMKNFGKMLQTALLPYKPMLDRSGISIVEYEETNEDLNYIIFGVKIIFPNQELLKKFVGEKYGK